MILKYFLIVYWSVPAMMLSGSLCFVCKPEELDYCPLAPHQRPHVKTLVHVAAGLISGCLVEVHDDWLETLNSHGFHRLIQYGYSTSPRQGTGLHQSTYFIITRPSLIGFLFSKLIYARQVRASSGSGTKVRTCAQTSDSRWCSWCWWGCRYTEWVLAMLTMS